jgi:hypothetical protein
MTDWETVNKNAMDSVEVTVVNPEKEMARRLVDIYFYEIVFGSNYSRLNTKHRYADEVRAFYMRASDNLKPYLIVPLIMWHREHFKTNSLEISRNAIHFLTVDYAKTIPFLS